MGDIRVTSTAGAACGSHAFQHNFQLLAAKFVVSLESSDRHSLIIAVIPVSHWSALHTPKSLRVPIAKISEGRGKGMVQAS
jgi:hypothetical protein